MVLEQKAFSEELCVLKLDSWVDSLEGWFESYLAEEIREAAVGRIKRRVGEKHKEYIVGGKT